MPKTVVTKQRKNFETLRRAFLNGDVALLECQLKSTGEPVPVIVTVAKVDGEYEFTPFAVMFTENPYDLLNPPCPEGGFEQGG